VKLVPLRRAGCAARSTHHAQERPRAPTQTYLGRSHLHAAPRASIPGVEEVACDLDAQKVTVTGAELPPAEDMLAALKKWGEAAGKTVELAQ